MISTCENQTRVNFLPLQLNLGVEHMVLLVDELHDADLEWLPVNFLFDEVYKLEETLHFFFSSDAEEIDTYMAYRAVACAIEQNIFDLMKGMPEVRWLFFTEILDKARELSVMLSPCEPAEEDEV